MTLCFTTSFTLRFEDATGAFTCSDRVHCLPLLHHSWKINRIRMSGRDADGRQSGSQGVHRSKSPHASTDEKWVDLSTSLSSSSSSQQHTTERATENTSLLSKVVVSGLTTLTNFVMFPFLNNKTADAETVDILPNTKLDLTVSELVDALRDEYVVSNYLWTGNIALPVYQDDCTFTDPTLSFQGLQQYQRNIKSLRPIVDALLIRGESVLQSIDKIKDENVIEAHWVMVGQLRLPWRPIVDVAGRTRFSFDPQNGNRVFDYNEFWKISAKEALWQLITPGKQSKILDEWSDK